MIKDWIFHQFLFIFIIINFLQSSRTLIWKIQFWNSDCAQVDPRNSKVCLRKITQSSRSRRKNIIIFCIIFIFWRSYMITFNRFTLKLSTLSFVNLNVTSEKYSILRDHANYWVLKLSICNKKKPKGISNTLKCHLFCCFSIHGCCCYFQPLNANLKIFLQLFNLTMTKSR